MTKMHIEVSWFKNEYTFGMKFETSAEVCMSITIDQTHDFFRKDN